ncbi:hypothetical protein JMJ35_000860 [Cladonia borealis]|uniref:Cytochrome P450 n=1 Tax=Cladonia borealis TaxID=184061 RepID=A0AA39R7E0_9LECA|nr:hypothetical protein JMJ35_000860 [Cladonia borealis]
MFVQIFRFLQLVASDRNGSIDYLRLTLPTLALAWLSWRIWAFTLKPAFQPREPRELPYWIPSHAISFFRDTEGILTRARLYFGNSREPFALTVAGARLYIITAPQDATEIYKNSKTLTFDEYVRDVMKSIGVSDDGITKLWKPPGENGNDRLHKALAHAAEGYYREQLLPGHQLDILWERVLGEIASSINWDNLPVSTLNGQEGSKSLSLLEWTSDVLLKSVVNGFFGDRLLQMDRQLLQNFAAFDKESWKLTYKLPRIIAKDMYEAKDKMVRTVEAYLRLPKDQRSEATWLVKKLEIETAKMDMDSQDLAAMITSLVWVILSNAYKLCFWMMAYLVHDSLLYAAIKAEVTVAVGGGLLRLETRLDECPRLAALYDEVLRLTASSASIRTVESDTTLRNVVLSAGGKVLLPFRQLHFNEKVFGNNVDECDAERFLRDKDLSNSSSFRPFGGGSTYCPGRYVARREVMVFIALAMSRFDDIMLAENELFAFPKLDTKTPSLGIMMPMIGEDVQVVVRKHRST